MGGWRRGRTFLTQLTATKDTHTHTTAHEDLVLPRLVGEHGVEVFVEDPPLLLFLPLLVVGKVNDDDLLLDALPREPRVGVSVDVVLAPCPGRVLVLLLLLLLLLFLLLFCCCRRCCRC